MFSSFLGIQSHLSSPAHVLFSSPCSQDSVEWSNISVGWFRPYLWMFLEDKVKATGCPKKMWFEPIFEFLTLEGVFLGVINNSKTLGNKKDIGLLSKILSKWALFYWKSSNFLEFLWLCQSQKVKNLLKSQNIKWLLWHLKIFSILDMAIDS